jgi:formylglycine-generating enzyme required for sulfatase activity
MSMSFRAESAVLLILILAAGNPSWGKDAWPDLSMPPGAVGGGERDAAVIVGAENYLFVEHVPGAKQNAYDWQAYFTGTLKIPTDHVALLLDDDATNDAIRLAAMEKAAQAEAGGTLWFVFIGHGAPSKDGKDGLLVGVDAQQKAASVYSRSVSRNGLLGLLANGKQAKTVIVLDACFSGKSPSGQMLVAGLQPLITMRALPQGIDSRTVLMTAAKADQFAGPLPGGERPAFSYLALGGLRGWAADAQGRVTAGGLVDYARRALSFSRDRMQTPELATPEMAKVVLGTSREMGPDLSMLQREAAAASGRTPFVAKRPLAPAGNAGIEWIKIPGGTFMMGSSEYRDARPHVVTVKPFEMAKTMVTRKQYMTCVNAGVCTRQTDVGYVAGYTDDQPILGIDWNQAAVFSRWVGGRLPSEAEWEYAARSAGKDYKYPWGNAEATCERTVTINCGKSPFAPDPVCSRLLGNTEQGLCDMAGDALEWVEDLYHNSYDGAPINGGAWEDFGLNRVVRGGAWNDYAAPAVRSAFRRYANPKDRTNIASFRPIRQANLRRAPRGTR